MPKFLTSKSLKGLEGSTTGSKKGKPEPPPVFYTHLCPLSRKTDKRHDHVNSSPASFLHEIDLSYVQGFVQFHEDTDEKKRRKTVYINQINFTRCTDIDKFAERLKKIYEEGRMVLKIGRHTDKKDSKLRLRRSTKG